MDIGTILIVTFFLGFVYYTLDEKWKITDYEKHILGRRFNLLSCCWCICFNTAIIVFSVINDDYTIQGWFKVFVQSGASTYIIYLINLWRFNNE